MPRYKQPAIEVRELDKQLLLFLKAISIPDSLHRWILQRLECNRGEQEVEKAARRTSLEKTYQDTTKSLENLTKLRIRELINDEEFAKERQTLQREALHLQQSLDRLVQNEPWFEPARQFVSSNSRAMSLVVLGDSYARSYCLSARGVFSPLGRLSEGLD